MTRTVCGCVLVIALGLAGLGTAQEKAKGKLPLYWNKLGLSEEQRKKAIGIQTSYRQKIEDLKGQIATLQREEGQELAKILTPQQREELKKLINAKAFSAEPEQKPTDKKAAPPK